MVNKRAVSYHVMNMSCIACEQRIEKNIDSMEGIHKVVASYAKEMVEITFDCEIQNEESIIQTLGRMDYPVQKRKFHQKEERTWVKSIGILLLIVVGFKQLEGMGIFSVFPMANEETSLPMLFLIGLMTSVHCIAMCGGINIAQCSSSSLQAKAGQRRKWMTSLLYNSGRVVSYTFIGAIVGGIGSALILSGGFKGMVSILSSIFMLVMGVTMLGIFPSLRKFVPRIPRRFTKKMRKDRAQRKPFIIGMINGFMPCGPLQAMQLYALASGSVWLGAASMFLFSLGTVPLMFGLGVLSSYLSARFTKVMMKVSACLVVMLGFMMLNTGLVLSGFNPLF